MELDPRACYRALATRDARFDGRFFTAVRSTGIYCRPVCPARTPRPRNCLFFACAAAAQEAGFRPCLRCRPETSPGTPAWLGTSATVSRALRLIGEGALDQAGVDELAGRLGVGSRHLRRLFDEHLGASPVAVAQTRRLHFAKKLIDETRLPLSEVAFAAGFSSIRRFNAAIAETYAVPPRELRRTPAPRSAATRVHPRRGAAGVDLTLKLSFRPPFDWGAIVGFLAPRATPGVESVSAQSYRRSVRLGEVSGVVEVSPVAGDNHLCARLLLTSPGPLIQAAERLRRLFDLGADPGAIGRRLRRDPALAPRLRARPGVRIPGAWDGFELAVRAILGQQVTVKGATTLAARLVARHGEPLASDLAAAGLDAPQLLFPRPEILATADLTDIGLPRTRAAAISALARAAAGGQLGLDEPRGLEATLAALTALPGIGDWTAQYVAMRALGEPDAFPAGDLGLRRALDDGGGPPTPRALTRRAEAWRPFRAYAAMLLWLEPRPSGARRPGAASRRGC